MIFRWSRTGTLFGVILVFAFGLSACAVEQRDVANLGIESIGYQGETVSQELSRRAALADDCRGKLDLLEMAEGSGVWTVATTVTPRASVNALPIVPHRSVRRVRSDQRSATPCLLMVDFEPARLVTRTIKEDRTIQSLRRVEVKPVVAQAPARKDEIADRHNDLQLIKTGNPLADLAGTAAIGMFGLIGDAIDKMRNLDITDASKTGLVVESEPYELSAKLVQTDRAGLYRMAIVDSAVQKVWHSERWHSETREFHLITQRDPDDIGTMQTINTVDVAELTAWETGSPLMRFEQFVNIAANARQTPGNPSSTDMMAQSIIRDWRATRKTPPLDAGSQIAFTQALVRLNYLDGEALGVFVGPETVLTAEAALPRAGLIQVKPEQGTVSFGVVRARDEKTGLALIYVPQSKPVMPIDPAELVEQVWTLDEEARRPLSFRDVAEGLVRYRSIQSQDTMAPGTPLISKAGLAGLVVSSEHGLHRIVAGKSIERFIENSAPRPTAIDGA